jgi:hypothetical protein
MPNTTLADLERRHSPHDPVVVAQVGAAIDRNGGPLTDAQLTETLQKLDEE